MIASCGNARICGYTATTIILDDNCDNSRVTINATCDNDSTDTYPYPVRNCTISMALHDFDELSGFAYDLRSMYDLTNDLLWNRFLRWSHYYTVGLDYSIKKLKKRFYKIYNKIFFYYKALDSRSGAKNVIIDIEDQNETEE